jgi:hypothetical protein
MFAAAFLLLLVWALSLRAGPASAQNNGGHWNDNGIRHVLLISIDGMHALDFINCANGISGANGGAPYCPNLADLKSTGIDYLYAYTSEPSDSFPGLMALVTGGSPRSVGAFYDDAYDRSLDPPYTTTGDGLAGAPGDCVPFTPPTGTSTEYDEGIDYNIALLNGGASGVGLIDGGVASINSQRLPRDPAKGCAPVYPWNFVRTNTIFGVVHSAGGYTAWSDKHPSYSAVNGPGNGTNVDDYFSPEINSVPVSVPFSLPSAVGGTSCTPLPDQTAVTSSNTWTDSFQNIDCYDTIKVAAILNEINGKNHDGSKREPVPEVFGMNFQAASVGQKLIEKSVSVTGGYLDAQGTPTEALLNEIKFVDASIGEMVAALKSNGLFDSTLIVVTAKHGQSPIDSSRYLGIGIVPEDTSATSPITTSPATIAAKAGCLPFSESPLNPTGIGPTEDDVSLIWLNSSCTTESVVNLLETQSPATNNIAGIGEIFWGAGITQLYNAPGLPPNDPRTPDILVTPNIGVTLSGSSKKLAEHGGFAHDDTNVMMLLSNPNFQPLAATIPVTTMQVAPTILKALGLDPQALQSVQQEGTETLPKVF